LQNFDFIAGSGVQSISPDGVEESHPSRKNKYAARVGHPNSIPKGEMLHHSLIAVPDQPDDEPGQGHALHPRAGDRDQLAEEEEAEVPMLAALGRPQ
jgi:hypothetical protein